MKIQTAICVAIEEVFVNIAHYAYPDGEGDMSLIIGFDNQSRDITLRMTDKGIPFDPLGKSDPDITLSAEDREIGGLGIFITKKTMDSLSYSYENGENILTMIKKI
jgi:anti-sigma regulatory factor (Ser/Thr protein kinase)